MGVISQHLASGALAVIGSLRVKNCGAEPVKYDDSNETVNELKAKVLPCPKSKVSRTKAQTV